MQSLKYVRLVIIMYFCGPNFILFSRKGVVVAIIIIPYFSNKGWVLLTYFPCLFCSSSGAEASCPAGMSKGGQRK